MVNKGLTGALTQHSIVLRYIVTLMLNYISSRTLHTLSQLCRQVVAVSTHTTIVPQSRHKRYSTVNAFLTTHTEQYRTPKCEKSEPKPALSDTPNPQ